MNQGDEWKWMISKLSGNSSREELELLTIWINASKQNKVLFEEVARIWESSTIKLMLDHPATEQEWKKLQDRIQNEKVKTKWLTLPQTWIATAASVIILIGALFYLKPAANKETETPVIVKKEIEKQEEPKVENPVKTEDRHIYITSSSKVKTVKLPDNSQVWLNTNSTLRYAPDFKNNRTLILTGEAYFIVTHDLKHPFTVSTGKVNTTVMGTSFNVKEKDSTVFVTVAHGKVKMTDEQSRSQVMLTVEENGTYKNGKLAKGPNNQRDFATWRERNNPSYEKEKKTPASYLTNNFSWKKNQINRSVIEGSLTNTASLATYHRVVLKATYLKPRSKKTVTVIIPIEEPVRPGQTVSYRKKLLDILTHTKDLKVEIDKAEAIPNQ